MIDYSSDDDDGVVIYTPTASVVSSPGSDDGAVVYTPAASTVSDPDEMVATPTTQASPVIFAGNFPSSGFPWHPPNNDQPPPLPAFAYPLLTRLTESTNSVPDEDDGASMIVHDAATTHDEENGEFDTKDIERAIKASQTSTSEERLISEAMRESLEDMSESCKDFEPVTREQHRIQSAYVEDMTTERGFHSKEDDEFFFGEYEDTMCHSDDDEHDGDGDETEREDN